MSGTPVIEAAVSSFTPNTRSKAETSANIKPALPVPPAGLIAACMDPNNPKDIMVKVGPLCIDKYEASVWTYPDGGGIQHGATEDDYGFNFPDNGNWKTPLYAVSKKEVIPSRYITWFQAQQACFLNGKRLLTNAECQAAASGTDDSGTSDANSPCKIFGTHPVNTGSKTDCVSKWGVHDMVENIAEMVGDWTQDSRPLPGLYSSTDHPTSPTYGNDYMEGVRTARPKSDGFPAPFTRGGAWRDESEAGIFSLWLKWGPSGSYSDTGFRCMSPIVVRFSRTTLLACLGCGERPTTTQTSALSAGASLTKNQNRKA